MDYVSNIDAAMHRASQEDIAAGVRWYRRMTIITQGHAARLGIAPLSVAGVYAAHSANTQWGANLRMVARILRGKPAYRGTLGNNIRKGEAILAGADVLDTLTKDKSAHKTKCFARACSGDTDAVVVDRWAQGVAVGWSNCGPKCKRGRHSCNYVPTGQEYIDIADAYRTVAAAWGMDPVIVQAITWISARKGN